MTKILSFIIYNNVGDNMIVYVDLIFIINFLMDFFLLLTVNIALKRYARIRRIIIASIFGSISLISLFIKISYINLCFLKLLMAISMCLISFGYKNIKYTFYNVLYLFMLSFILGGFIYYLNLEYSNKYIILLLGPFILYLFIKSLKGLKEIKNYHYKVSIEFKNGFLINLIGFLDTGNKLIDPVTNKPVIIINKKKIKGSVNIRSPMYVPYYSLNYKGILECIKPKKILIDDIEIKGYLIGLSDESFKLNGIDCLLNYKILEDIK